MQWCTRNVRGRLLVWATMVGVCLGSTALSGSAQAGTARKGQTPRDETLGHGTPGPGTQGAGTPGSDTDSFGTGSLTGELPDSLHSPPEPPDPTPSVLERLVPTPPIDRPRRREVQPPPPPLPSPRTIVLARCVATRKQDPDCWERRRKLLQYQLQYVRSRLRDPVSLSAWWSLTDAMEASTRGNLSLAIQTLRQIQREQPSSKDHADVQALALLEEAYILYYTERQTRKAMDRCGQALRTARHPYIKAMAYKEIGYIGYWSKEMKLPEARSHFNQALRELNAIDDAEAVARIVLPIATVYKHAGDSPVAVALLKEVSKRCSRVCTIEQREEIGQYETLWKA